MLIRLLILLLIPLGMHFSIQASDSVNLSDLSRSKNLVLLLSTPKSGSNLLTGCLTAITGRPISWLYWGNAIRRDHISYNRLEYPLVSDIPLLYRTHYEFAELKQIPSDQNKLIFLTRNPKELLYREFFLQPTQTEYPDPSFIKTFLDDYLTSFEIYDSWHPKKRKLIFYEDLINQEEKIAREVLEFMEEPLPYAEDFSANKQKYLSRLLKSYENQHKKNFGGKSSKDSPKPIFYTKNIPSEILEHIDESLWKTAPDIWEKYLKRFENPVSQSHYKLYCMYTPQFKHLFENFFLPSLKDDLKIVVREYPQDSPSGIFRSEGWEKTMLHKLELLQEAILENWNEVFFYSDIDIIFLKPILQACLSYLGDNDFVIQQGWPKNKLCAGFFVMKANEATLQLIKMAHTLLQDKICIDDQEALRMALDQFDPEKITWRFLPPEEFPNGRKVLKDPRGLYSPESEILIHDSMILFHANCCVGLEHKYHFLNRIQELCQK